MQVGQKVCFLCSGIKMAKTNSKTWQFNRQINLSVVIQLILLASLIVGSWVNIQRQLDLLQKDVSLLVESQKAFQQKVESLSVKSISHEYRLQTVEKAISQAEVRRY